VLAGIVGRGRAYVKPFSKLESHSCVVALSLCVAQILVQLLEFGGSDRLLRAFADVTATGMGQSLPTGSLQFATHGANKRDVGMSNTHDWAAFDCFRLDVSKFDDDCRLCGDESLDRCFWFWPKADIEVEHVGWP